MAKTGSFGIFVVENKPFFFKQGFLKGGRGLTFGKYSQIGAAP